MVIGLRENSRRSPTLQRDYLIHIQEIKPWPPSQSLRTLRSVLIQWEHGERYSGSTKAVIPFLGSAHGDGKIEFNESFRISVTLARDMSVKGGDSAAFQKSCLELNLFEPRRDKTVKGQLLGTALVDFADYGLAKEAQSISIPLNSKRIYSNTKPLLYLEIQSIDKGRTSSRNSLSKVLSMDKSSGESVSALMKEEYDEEAEIASITDDDVSSHSSMALSSSAFEANGGLSIQNQENGSQAMSDGSIDIHKETHLAPDQHLVKSEKAFVEDIHESSKDKDVATCGNEFNCNDLHESEESRPEELLAGVAPADDNSDENMRLGNSVDSQAQIENNHNHPVKNIDRNGSAERGQAEEVLSQGANSDEDEKYSEISDDEIMEQESCTSDALTPSGENHEINGSTIIGRLHHVKSVRSSADSGTSNGSVRNGKQRDASNGHRVFVGHEIKETKVYRKDTRNTSSDGRIIQLERRIKMLEGELREAAAVEVGLYSIVAEHGSSTNKVHAPARRLSRLYLHTCKESSRSKRASAAKSAVSGLVVVAKACGNDVPRLTYWLSNSVVLRSIIEQQLPLYAGPLVERRNSLSGKNRSITSCKLKESSISMESKDAFCRSFDDWEDPRTFTLALEKIEAWIFSRVIESIWWQTLTPHMQSSAAKAINTEIAIGTSKSYRRASSSNDQDQVNISLELWKKAFRDACERLCPVRAGGHDCGCLPVLARLIMEQCVARLDVAMFNAILRESDDDIPTDPVSDPISDAKVLPIPAGKASFGAGAQLKNAIGNWSRWLTDLFGIDDDSHREMNALEKDDDSDEENYDTSSKCFHLLNALSDLMMLPKDMLLSRSIRKEVCPTFGVPMIKRVLHNFVPDEFCPDPVPDVVLEALSSEDSLEDEEDSIANFPCTAAQIVYMPPPATSLCGILGEIGSESRLRRSGSSVLKKSYTSDDELDELDSPLTSIINGFQVSEKPSLKMKESGSQIAIRYQLLREVWLSSD